MSIASEITRINTNIAAAYTACGKRGAVMPQSQNSANLAGTIMSIRSEGVKAKDVNFYDYDGTRLYAYSKAEYLALSSFPSPPVHEGLSGQGWNKTFANITAYVTKYGICDVGATYITDDGKTRLYLSVPDSSALSPVLYIRLAGGTLTIGVNGQIIGTTTNSSDSYTDQTITVDLPSPEAYPASYVIELSYTGTQGYYLGSGRNLSGALGTATKYLNTLEKVEVGENCALNYAAFYRCASLETITLPVDTADISTTIDSNTFCYCSSLKSIIIPDGITTIVNSVFLSCYSLGSVVLPDGVTSIGSNAFNGCAEKNMVFPDGLTTIGASAFNANMSLKNIIVPDSVTSIGANGFSIRNLTVLDVSAFTDPSSLPTIESNTLTNTPDDLIIYAADQTMLNAFSAATNWSAHAGKFQIKGV